MSEQSRARGPAVLASAFNILLEGFCAVRIAVGGEPIGWPVSDAEAIDTLTRLLLHGLAGQPAQTGAGTGVGW